MISLRSEVTKRLLAYFFINPHEQLYLNELVQKLGVDKRNLGKKLKELDAQGLLISQVKGNLKLYSIRKDFPLYNEYKNIVLRTFGLVDRLKTELQTVPGVKEVYLYGSMAINKTDEHSDIDLLVIGSHDVVSIQRKLSKLQKEMNREINAVHMDEKELKKRRLKGDEFIQNIFKNKYIRII